MATTFDAFPMVQKGEHEKALGLAVIASFFGGIISAAALITLAPHLAAAAIHFGPFEYFALVLFTFSCISSFVADNLWRPYLAACLGLLISMVGMEPTFGVPRFTGGFNELGGGISMVPTLIGVFALPQILADIKNADPSPRKFSRISFIRQAKTLKFFGSSIGNVLRSSLIGIGIGILPGVGPGLSNIVAYTQAKRASKHPETFGTGEKDGIIASETSNNASMGGALIPLLTLGIPGDSSTLMLVGAFLLHGVQLGPLLFKTQLGLVYTVFGALLIASAVTLVLQLSLMNLYARVLTLKKQYLIPLLLVFCSVGSYALNNRMFDVWVFFVAGLAGFIFEKTRIPVLPLILGFILGPMAEMNFRAGLDITNGSLLPFVTRPVSLMFILASVFFLVAPLLRMRKVKRSPLQSRDAAAPDTV